MKRVVTCLEQCQICSEKRILLDSKNRRVPIRTISPTILTCPFGLTTDRTASLRLCETSSSPANGMIPTVLVAWEVEEMTMKNTVTLRILRRAKSLVPMGKSLSLTMKMTTIAMVQRLA